MLAAAHSSDVAELLCTTSLICSIPSLICCISTVWFASVSAISDTSPVIILEFCAIISSCCAVSSANETPFPTAFTDVLIKAADSFTACALWSASWFTWLATTANPFPASPALAASIDAFNARRFVCDAISLMVSIIFSICMDASLISSIDFTISRILALFSKISSPSATTFVLILLAACEFCWTCSETFSTVAVSSSTAAAWFVAPSASSVAPDDTCSAPPDTWSETVCIPFTIAAILSSNAIKEFRIPTKSPFHSTFGCTSKFPSENSFIARSISST